MKNQIILLAVILLFGSCTKNTDPVIDPANLIISPIGNVTASNGDSAAFRFITTNAATGVIAGTTVSWTCDNISIGLAASGTGDIAKFKLVNTGTTLAVAHIVATPYQNGQKGTPLTITVQVTSAGNTFTALNCLPLSTGIIPAHWYADAGKLYYGGTPKLYWQTPSDTSALYYGVVYKNNIAGQIISTFGPGTNYNTPLGNVVGINMQATDTASVVFKITKSDSSVVPTSLRVYFIDPNLEQDKTFGGNSASYGALNDSLIVNLSQRVNVQGQFTKIDKAKPLTIYSFKINGIATDYYTIPYLFGRYLSIQGKPAANVTVALSLSDGTTYRYVIYGGAIARY